MDLTRNRKSEGSRSNRRQSASYGSASKRWNREQRSIMQATDEGSIEEAMVSARDGSWSNGRFDGWYNDGSCSKG